MKEVSIVWDAHARRPSLKYWAQIFVCEVVPEAIEGPSVCNWIYHMPQRTYSHNPSGSFDESCK